jgi:hypothetical protein
MQTSRYFLLVLLSLLLTGSAQAWCETHPSVEAETREAPLIFIGSLIGTTKVIDKDGFICGTFFQVRAKEMLKGAPVPTVELYCDNDSGRFEIDAGFEYLIFAHYEEHFDGVSGRHLTIDECGNYGALPKSGKTLAAVRKALPIHSK